MSLSEDSVSTKAPTEESLGGGATKVVFNELLKVALPANPLLGELCEKIKVGFESRDISKEDVSATVDYLSGILLAPKDPKVKRNARIEPTLKTPSSATSPDGGVDPAAAEAEGGEGGAHKSEGPVQFSLA